MKNGILILAVLVAIGTSSMVQAKQQVCVFDLLGKAGESYKMMLCTRQISQNPYPIRILLS